jgi:hypothetical protein
MKIQQYGRNKKKSTAIGSIFAVIVLLGLVFTACGDGGGGGIDSNTGNGFTSIAAFKTWLDAQPANDKAAPYNVKVNIADLGGAGYTAGSLGNAVRTNYTKYVSLDLSGSTFTSIGEDAFSYCSSLTSVTIGSGVTSIGDSAFALCGNLTSITIPASVTSIGDSAFSHSGLTSITIPAGVTSIGQGAFAECSNLTSITIGSGVTIIGYGTFSYCTSLTSITIPAGVTSIGDYAFRNCTGLTSVTFQGTITPGNLNANAFGQVGWSDSIGDLRAKYLAGGVGTYTRSGSGSTAVWTKTS